MGMRAKCRSGRPTSVPGEPGASDARLDSPFASSSRFSGVFIVSGRPDRRSRTGSSSTNSRKINIPCLSYRNSRQGTPMYRRLGFTAATSAVLIIASTAAADAAVLSSTPLSSSHADDGTVYASVQVGSRLFVGGSFTSIDGAPRGCAWPPWMPRPAGSTPRSALTWTATCAHWPPTAPRCTSVASSPGSMASHGRTSQP